VKSRLVFSVRCNLYISRLCYDVSVRLSVTFVHCGHRVQWIPDTFACLDRWMSLLLTDNASPGSLDGMMPGFLVEEGRGHLALSWPLLGPLVYLCYQLTWVVLNKGPLNGNCCYYSWFFYVLCASAGSRVRQYRLDADRLRTDGCIFRILTDTERVW